MLVAYCRNDGSLRFVFEKDIFSYLHTLDVERDRSERDEVERCNSEPTVQKDHHLHPPLEVRSARPGSKTRAAMLHAQELPKMVLLESVE